MGCLSHFSPSKAVIYDAKKMEPVYSFGTGGGGGM